MPLTTDTRRPTSGAYKFNGTSQYLITRTTRSAVTSDNALTMAGWLNATNWSAAGKRAITLGAGNVAWFGTSGASPKRLRFLCFTSANQTLDFGTGITFVNNGWAHIAVTLDMNGDKVMRGYINGVENADTLTATGTVIGWGAAGNATISGQDGGAGNWWDGLLEDLAVWRCRLTAPEILALYRRDVYPDGLRVDKLGACWPLDGQLDDIGPHGCHLKFGTAPTVTGGTEMSQRVARRTL